MTEATGAHVIPIFRLSSRPARLVRLLTWAQGNWEAFLLLAVAAAVYQPWNSTLLPLTDFGTFLAERNPSDSLFGQFLSLVHYYAADGRICLIQYLDVVLAIRAFGTWAPGWFWMFFALNCTILLLGRSVLLLTGASRTATFVALVLWSTMTATAEGWIRPTGEPFALIFFLIALRLAVNYSDAPDWRRRAFGVALCAIGIVYSKELLVVLLPVGWLFSRVRSSVGQWSWAPWSSRDAFLLKLVGVVALLAMAPIVYVFAMSHQDNYTSLYGQSTHRWGVTLQRLEMVLIPAPPRLHRLISLFTDPGWTLLLTLPSLIWIRLIVGGVVAGPRRRIAWPLAISMTWVALGLVAYVPWPLTLKFYMFPFAFGAMFGGAHVISCLFAGGKGRVRSGLAALTILVAADCVEARTAIYHRELTSRLNSDVIDAIVRHGSVTTLVGATPEPRSGRESWALRFAGFGSATKKLRVGQSQDMSCAQAREALAAGRDIVVISTDWGCGRLASNSEVLEETVPLRQWPRLWQRNSVAAEMFLAMPQRGVPDGSSP